MTMDNTAFHDLDGHLVNGECQQGKLCFGEGFCKLTSVMSQKSNDFNDGISWI